jgi:hypothetical protein
MTLYEVDLDKLAVPVKSMEEGSSKTKRKLKEPKEPKEPKVFKSKEPKYLKPKELKEPKEKKPRAKKVKVETVAVKTEEVSPVLDAPAEAKVEEVKVEEVKVEEAKVEGTKDEETKVEEPKAKKPRVARPKKDPAVPPQWFAKYVEGVKKEQATLKTEKVAPKQIKEEARETASKSWNNGLTRNRVENEVNGHMSRMYSMIFSK